MQPPVFNFLGRSKRGSQSFQDGYQRQQQEQPKAVNPRQGSRTGGSQSLLTRTHNRPLPNPNQQQADPRLGPHPPHKRAKLSHEHDGPQDLQRWGSESTRPSSEGYLPRNGDQDLHSQHYFGQPPNPQTGYGSADTGVSQRRMPQALQMLSPAQMSIPPLPLARSSQSPRISFGDDDDIPPLPSLRQLMTLLSYIPNFIHLVLTGIFRISGAGNK